MKGVRTMQPFDVLEQRLAARPKQLQQAKESGIKLVGFSGLGYVPEEIIHAAGACGIRLIRGGDPEALAAAAGYMDRILCPFSRAQFGYYILEEEQRYQMIDYFVCAITCQHMRRVADAFEFYTELPVLRIGVPHNYTSAPALQYYRAMLEEMKAGIERLLGCRIPADRLRSSVMLYNRLRDLLHEISLLRKTNPPGITGKDFFRLMHASFYLDPQEMIDILEKVLAQLTASQTPAPHRGPRILLTGNMLAVGDYKVIDLIEQAGGSIISEQFCGGVRHYDNPIALNGDLMDSIARRYLTGRAPCAFMRPSKARLDYVVELARQFAADGIIWYQLRYCETYTMEFYYFNTLAKNAGIPVLQLESEYDVEERGTLLNRIEGFIESLERRG